MEVKKADVLLAVISALDSGNLRLSLHAQERMNVRGITYADVSEAILNGKREGQKDDYRQNPKNKLWSWRYSIRGPNENEDKDLRIVVIMDDPQTVIVTVIDLNRKESL
jgi:hypothetical protein